MQYGPLDDEEEDDDDDGGGSAQRMLRQWVPLGSEGDEEEDDLSGSGSRASFTYSMEEEEIRVSGHFVFIEDYHNILLTANRCFMQSHSSTCILIYFHPLTCSTHFHS